MKRTLYDCFWAKVKGSSINCAKGHWLAGAVDIRQLERGDPLAFGVCQECPDFESMGDPVPKGERGWVKKGVNNERG